MYALYSKTFEIDGMRYRFKEQATLFGCNEGYIPWLLKKHLTSDSNEPFSWHVNIESAMTSVDQGGETLVINLKPNAKEPTLALYEIIDAWGYSSSGWTPIMLYLKGLFIDESPTAFNEHDFKRKDVDIEDPIFSLMYLNGTVKEGALSGRWTPPGPSSTNAVLLWPDTFSFFAEKANEIMARAQHSQDG